MADENSHAARTCGLRRGIPRSRGSGSAAPDVQGSGGVTRHLAETGLVRNPPLRRAADLHEHRIVAAQQRVFAERALRSLRA